MSEPVSRVAPTVRATGPAPRAASGRMLVSAVLLLAAGVAVPWLVGSQLMLTLMTQAVIYAILATAIGFLIRQNGLTSFGHAAFFGLAVYLLALNGKYDLVPAEVAVLAAIALPAALAFAAGLVIVRLPRWPSR